MSRAGAAAERGPRRCQGFPTGAFRLSVAIVAPGRSGLRGASRAPRSSRIASALAALLPAFLALPGHAEERQDVNIFCGALQGYGSIHARTGTCGLTLGYGVADGFSLRAVYLNEGHLPNHHRDGFGLQAGYERNFGAWRLQFATGPYYSMDTTRTDEGNVLNDKNLGLLTSVALKWYPRSDWYVGVGYNNVWMRNRLGTHGAVLMLGTDLGPESADVETDGRRRLGLWLGASTTTHPDSELTRGAQIEWIVPVNDTISGSVAAIYEGNTGLANRKGVAGQVWYNESRARWTFSVGAGPYLARDTARDDDRTGVMGVASLRVKYRYNSRTDLGLNMNRVVSFYHRDADMFLLGLQRAF